MKTKTLCWILAGALVALGILGVTGCDRNEAQEAAAVEQPAPVAGATGEPEPDEAMLDEREEAIARREAELARRELEAASAERALAERMVEVEARLEGLEERGAEVAGREPLQDTADLYEPFETEPEPESERIARRITMTLPASTPIRVEFADPLSSDTSLPGDGIRATVVSDVLQDGYVVVPAGSKVLGTVASVTPSKKIGGQARMSLSFERLDLPSGEIVDIRSVLDVSGQNQKKKDAATIGGSAAGGAILGRVLSKKKGKGTAIGAILGAAVGAAVASENKSDPVVLEPGMLAEFFLESPVEVAVVVGPTDAVATNR